MGDAGTGVVKSDGTGGVISTGEVSLFDETNASCCCEVSTYCPPKYLANWVDAFPAPTLDPLWRIEGWDFLNPSTPDVDSWKQAFDSLRASGQSQFGSGYNQASRFFQFDPSSMSTVESKAKLYFNGHNGWDGPIFVLFGGSSRGLHESQVSRNLRTEGPQFEFYLANPAAFASGVHKVDIYDGGAFLSSHWVELPDGIEIKITMTMTNVYDYTDPRFELPHGDVEFTVRWFIGGVLLHTLTGYTINWGNWFSASFPSPVCELQTGTQHYLEHSNFPFVEFRDVWWKDWEFITA